MRVTGNTFVNVYVPALEAGGEQVRVKTRRVSQTAGNHSEPPQDGPSSPPALGLVRQLEKVNKQQSRSDPQ